MACNPVLLQGSLAFTLVAPSLTSLSSIWLAPVPLQGSLAFTLVAPSQLLTHAPMPLSDAVVGWMVDCVTSGVSEREHRGGVTRPVG